MCLLLLLLGGTGIAVAQTNDTKDAPPPDVEFRARVIAREIYFHEVGNVTYTFLGSPKNRNIWLAERINLPKPVEAKVIYRNAGVVLTITSTLPNIEEIVDEALRAVEPPNKPKTP
jgi:hypothetical protein